MTSLKTSFITFAGCVTSVVAVVFLAVNTPASAYFHAPEGTPSEGADTCMVSPYSSSSGNSSISNSSMEDESVSESVDESTVTEEYSRYATIGDTVFLDINKNGMQDANEAGIPGVTVLLYSNKSTGSGPTLVGSASTDNEGKYSIEFGISTYNFQLVIKNFNTVLMSKPSIAAYSTHGFYPSTEYPWYDGEDMLMTRVYTGWAVQSINAISSDFPAEVAGEHDFGFAPCKSPTSSSSSSSVSSSSSSSSSTTSLSSSSQSSNASSVSSSSSSSTSSTASSASSSSSPSSSSSSANSSSSDISSSSSSSAVTASSTS